MCWTVSYGAGKTIPISRLSRQNRAANVACLAGLRTPRPSNDNQVIHNRGKAEMRLFKATLLLLSIVMPITTPGQNKIFPYKYFSDDLPNGLRVITVPTDYPNIVALYIAVNTGSRNEIEP